MKTMKLIIPALLILSGCTDVWSGQGRNGESLQTAMPECQAKARASAEHQFRFQQTEIYLEGTSDTRSDIARRETALCLKNKGFKLSRK